MLPMFYLGKRYSEQRGKRRKKVPSKNWLSLWRAKWRRYGGTQGAAPGVKKDALHELDI